MIHDRRPAPPASLAGPRSRGAQAALANGLKIVAVEREGIGTIELRLVVEGGAAAESPAESGLTGLAIRLLGRVRNAAGLSAAGELARQGATFRARATLDGGVVEISSMPGNLEQALATLGRIIITPACAEPDLAEAKAECAAIIRDEISRPRELAIRQLPRLIYPYDHPYARAFTGSGTEQGIARATSERIKDFHSRWLRPNRATLIAVGPIGTRELIALSERFLGAWQMLPQPSSLPMPPSIRTSRTRVVLIDRAAQPQAAIFAASPLPAKSHPDGDALAVADALLGGMFSSRLNLALRERDGYSYGAHSRMLHARFGGLWIVHSFVVADRLDAAIAEIQRQLHMMGGGGRIDDKEFGRARNHVIASAAAQDETNARLADAMQELVLNRLPHHHYAEIDARLSHLRPGDLTDACQRHIDGSRIAWLIVGDAIRLARRLVRAGFDEIETVAADRL